VIIKILFLKSRRNLTRKKENNFHFFIFFFDCRNSENQHNYIDRVRLRDSVNIFKGPGRGSGWRQRSLSSIDLTTTTTTGHQLNGKCSSSSGHINKKQQQKYFYNTGLYDLYSRIDTCGDIEDSYSVNTKGRIILFLIFLWLQ